MASSVDICNMALIKVGATRIASLTGTGKSEQVCSTLLQPVIDEVISDFDWKCARNRVLLAQDATAPACEYAFRYTLPTNPYCLQIREVQLGEDGDVMEEWEQEGRFILTNYDNDDQDLYLVYTGRIVDHTQLPSHVVQAVVGILAWKIAYSLTPKVELRETLRQEAVGPDGNGGLLLWAKQMERSSGVATGEEGNEDWADAGRS